ncbi:DUF3331 domain-containing protein [Caballeronia sp. LZ043]|uniref:DUF3331 domain-containing protein n=1 Tax=unclassified Caballeronia TaxID=2646786 RepID=UPI0038575B3F
MTIGLIEWTDSRSVILSWRGATTGDYAEQVWKLNKARKPGRCALSGCAVRRGDPVFRPSCRKRNLPGNAEYVVCEHAMRRFCIRSSGK